MGRLRRDRNEEKKAWYVKLARGREREVEKEYTYIIATKFYMVFIIKYTNSHR